ncbi:MAG TPA: DoxX family protein, partial [Verrucomicrobiae bacterium]|nr:DoxX family protein [Verrucomicrobiae bacterium]
MDHAETGTERSKSFTRFLPHLARVLMGIAFLIFGLNGFLNFMPAPKDMPRDIMDVMGAMNKAGFFKVVSAVEVLVGVLLLSNRFVPLALALIAPIIVAIL